MTMTTEKTATRDSSISLRIRGDQKAIIDRAAEAAGTSRTEFMLRASVKEAQDALLDQRMFVLSEQEYDDFVAALDAPAKINPRLQKLMNTKASWE